MANEKTAGQTAPVAAPQASSRTRMIRFSKPDYIGKPDKSGAVVKPYVADAVVTGLFTGLNVQLAGFMLQKSDSEIVVHFPFTSKTFSGVAAIQPETRTLTDEQRKVMLDNGMDVGDRSTYTPASSVADVERLRQAIRDAWADANKGGQTRYGVDLPLKF